MMSVYSSWAKKPDGMRRALLGPEPETMRRWLAFLRIALGALYLYAFAGRAGAGFFATFLHSLQAYAAANPLYVARRLLEGYVIPHSNVFGWIFLGAELTLGLLLLLGLGTRLVSLAAVLLHVLHLLGTLGTGNVSTLADCMFIAALLTTFGTAGGWRWSLDEMIMNRR